VIAAATWLTVLLLWAAEGPRRRWALYCLAATACIYLFIYDALLIVAHVSVVLLAPSLRHSARRAVLAAAGAVLAAAPILIQALRQQSQIAWLGTKVAMTPQNVVAEWFPQSALYEVAAWVLILAGLVLLAAGRAKLKVDRSTAFWLLLLWLALPTAALVAATLLGKPLWVQRYTLLSLPAAPILMAIACQRLKRFAVVALVVMAALAVPTYLQQRTPLAKGVDWGYAAAFVRAHAGPREGFYFTNPTTARPPRPMLEEYRSDFDGYRDLALDVPAAQTHRVWDGTVPVAAAAARAGGLERVIVIGSTAAPAATTEALAAFGADGFSVVTASRLPHTTAYLLSR
jgi:mannosyltransferase